MKTRGIKKVILLILTGLLLLLAAAAFAALGGEGQGTGTEEDPYLIATSADLAEFRDAVNNGSVDICAKLTANIDLGGVSGDATTYWTPIGNRDNSDSRNFSGTFDGQGYMVTGLYVNGSSGNDWGLFGVTSGDAVVKNLTVSGDVTTTGACAGIIVGNNYGTIENCTAHGSVTGTGGSGHDSYGGIAGGCTSGSIRNCFADVTVVSSGISAGGIVGTAHGINAPSQVVNCHSASPIVSGTDGIGGITGYNDNGIISCCTASCDVVSGNNNVGGVVGSNFGTVSTSTVSNCASACGTVSGNSNIGGVVGLNFGAGSTVSNCGWLSNGINNAVGYNEGGGTISDVISYDVASAPNVAVTCLPEPSSISVKQNGTAELVLKTYPSATASFAAHVPTSPVMTFDPSGMAEAAISGNKITITGKEVKSGLLTVSMDFKPTRFTAGCAGTVDAVPLSVSLPVTVTSTPPVPPTPKNPDCKPVTPNIPAKDIPADVEPKEVVPLPDIPAVENAIDGYDEAKLPVVADEDFKWVVPTQEAAKKAAQEAIGSGSSIGKITTPPISAVSLDVSGDTATFAFEISGDKLCCDKLEDLKVVKILADGTGELFKIAATSADFKDQYVTILKEGKVCADAISSADTYTLCAFVKDGGSFDLDGKENGKAVDPIAVVETKESPTQHSSSSGCSAGFAALALIFMVPLALPKKKR